MVGGEWARRRARDHLVAAVEALERSSAAGRHETMRARAVTETATVLGYSDLADRAQTVLRQAPDTAFLTGAITNVASAGPSAGERMRAIKPIDEIERDHPNVTGSQLEARLRRWADTEPHVAMCLGGRHRDATASASTSRVVVEIGATLAALGDINSARALLRHSALDASHREGLLVVLMIESARHGRADDASGAGTSADLVAFDTWSRVHLALGLAGRDPWSGYPVPDW
jgi:hypothetical protein